MKWIFFADRYGHPPSPIVHNPYYGLFYLAVIVVAGLVFRAKGRKK